MRIPMLPFVILLILCIACDIYIYIIAKKRVRSSMPSKIQLISSIALYVFVLTIVALPRRSGSDGQLLTIMWSLFGFISVYMSKLLFCIMDLVASIPCLWHGKRLRWMSIAGGILSVLLFLLVWWGALINRFNIQVKEVEIPVKNLPEAFDGYKIVQFSDIHVGTFDQDTTFVGHLVDRINSINGDMIVFTGDIVNRKTEELAPFVEVFSRLEAPDGIISILGNHDYGDYCDWQNEAAKAANMRELIEMQSKMGWNLLRNDHYTVYHDNDSLVVIGVENVGDPPFKVYGSLKDSYPAPADSATKILLTHNPAHWCQEISEGKNNIALTLSGHTHAMQMELFGFSPAVFRYKTWGGLYNNNSGERPLYVNIGAGTVGFPMRIGATPEITVITLKKSR